MDSSNQLLGVWQATSVIVSGQTIPCEEDGAIRLILTETRFTTQRGAETLFDSSYTTDLTKNPMHIEMIGTEGDFEGRPALGIYLLDEETLKICYKMPGFPRPTDFTSAVGSGAFLITLKRVQ